MTSKRMTPLLLAASVFLTGATGLFIESMTPAHAITSVDELSDVNRNHWAFEALQDLVEKYDVIEGYPSKVFRGNKAPTRWEMAAALNALIKSVGRDLARLGAEKANKSDLAALARLQEEFKNELAALNARTSALEARASAIEAKNVEQDNRLSLLEKTQIHGDMTFGGFADIASNGVGSPDPDGILDGISTVGRLRLTLDVPVKEDQDDSLLGAGTVHARIVSAFGRTGPIGAQANGDGNVVYPFSVYSRIAADASAFNEGFGTGSAGILNGQSGNTAFTRPNLFLESVYYKQHFKSGIPLLTDLLPGVDVLPDNDDWRTTGDMYVGLVRWWDLFDVSPYRGNDLDQFQNGAFFKIPGLSVNYAQPMVAYQLHQGLGKNYGLDVTGAVGSPDVGDAMDGFNLTYEARLNYQTAFLGENFTKPGSLYAGGYHIWNMGNRRFSGGTIGNQTVGLASNAGASIPNRQGTFLDSNNDKSSANSFYVGWNQEWYKGIGTNVGYLLNNTATNQLAFTTFQPRPNYVTTAAKQALTSVLSIPMSAFGTFRPKDVFGVGYSFVELQENGAATTEYGDAWEQVVEAYYKFQVNDNVSVIPSVQLIFNRLGLEKNDVSTVIGLRTNYTF